VEALAERVLARRFAALRGERDWDWEELRFRVTVGDHAGACDWAGCGQPPYPPEQAGRSRKPTAAIASTIEPNPTPSWSASPAGPRRRPHRHRAGSGDGGVAGGGVVTTASRAGAVSRTDLDQALRKITDLVDQVREAGWESDPIGEHRALRTARAKLADLDAQLADRRPHTPPRLHHRLTPDPTGGRAGGWNTAEAGQNRVSRTRSGRYPVGPSWASSPSMSTSIAPKKLTFSLCAGEMRASTSSSMRRPDRRIESTARS
jgi:hypothetical protein